MEQLLGLAAANLLSPVVLFFALGLGAALLRSDAEIGDHAYDWRLNAP